METLFFFRTRLSLQHEQSTLEALSRAFCGLRTKLPRTGDWGHSSGPFDMVFLNRGQTTWENGVVVRCDVEETPARIAQQVADVLALLDAWAIIDSNGDCTESIGGGPVSLFFREYPGNQFLQIYMMDRDARIRDTASEAVIGKFRGAARPAFHFGDGKIVFASTREAAPTAVQRCAKILGSIWQWAIVSCDKQGRAGPLEHPVWTPRDFGEAIQKRREN